MGCMNPIDDCFLSRAEVMRRWRVSITTVKRREQQGILRPIRMSTHVVRYRLSDVVRAEDMLREQPDLVRKDPERDMDLWRHLFAPDDLVRVGNGRRAACETVAAEWCSGNTWSGESVVATTALCWPALALIRGATCKEPMSRGEACEAVLGRLRAGGIEIAMVVEDGDG